MNALERQQYENTIVLLSQPDNEFEKCFIMKLEKGKRSESRHRSLSSASQEAGRGVIPTHSMLTHGQIQGTYLGISKYLESMMSTIFK